MAAFGSIEVRPMMEMEKIAKDLARVAFEKS
jgi:hypothetical protein